MQHHNNENEMKKVRNYMAACAAAIVLLASVLLSGAAVAQPLNLFADLGGADAIARITLFFGVGMVGMIGHYVKKWLRGEIEGNFVDYMFRRKPKATALALITLGSAALTALLANQLDNLTASQLITSAFTAGYACDSAVNDSTSPEGKDQAVADASPQTPS
jgi:hypothetical protein